MKKIAIIIVVLALSSIGQEIFAEELESAKMLPPIVAQTYGPGQTVIMWHDTNNDGKPEFKATYIFKDGRLYLIEKDFDMKDLFKIL